MWSASGRLVELLPCLFVKMKLSSLPLSLTFLFLLMRPAFLESCLLLLCEHTCNIALHYTLVLDAHKTKSMKKSININSRDRKRDEMSVWYKNSHREVEKERRKVTKEQLMRQIIFHWISCSFLHHLFSLVLFFQVFNAFCAWLAV